MVAVCQAASSVVASHATVSSPDRVKPVLHANVATLPWSLVAENATVPSAGAGGAAEHEFTANVWQIAQIMLDPHCNILL